MEQQNPQSTETYYKFKDIIFIRWLRNIFKTAHPPAGQRGFRPKEPLSGKPPRGIYGDLSMTDAFFNLVTLPKQNAALKEELAERTANLKTQLAKSRALSVPETKIGPIPRPPIKDIP